jgi:hypothetical protein
VVRPQDYDHIILLIADLPEPVGANLAGKDVAGMGNDNGDRLFNFDRDCILKEFLDGELQPGCGVSIELSRDCRFADIGVGRFFCLTRYGKSKTNDKHDKAQS